jgi:hypothetical protein
MAVTSAVVHRAAAMPVTGAGTAMVTAVVDMAATEAETVATVEGIATGMVVATVAGGGKPLDFYRTAAAIG